MYVSICIYDIYFWYRQWMETKKLRIMQRTIFGQMWSLLRKLVSSSDSRCGNWGHSVFELLSSSLIMFYSILYLSFFLLWNVLCQTLSDLQNRFYWISICRRRKWHTLIVFISNCSLICVKWQKTTIIFSIDSPKTIRYISWLFRLAIISNWAPTFGETHTNERKNNVVVCIIM